MYTYIIVDDEALLRKGMLKRIESSGIGDKLQCVGEAENGEEGLELIEKFDPDIVLTDMRMPEMDGKSFLKLIQQQYPDKKVIVISGYSDFEYMKEAISAKAVGYLLKPFSREEIVDTLGKAIQLIVEERSVQQKMEYSELKNEEISYTADLQTLCNMILGIHRKEKVPSLLSNKLQMLKQAEQFLLITFFSKSKIKEDEPDIDDRLIYIPYMQNEHMGFFLLFLSDLEADMPGSTTHILNRIEWQIDNTQGTPVIGVSRPKQSLMQLDEAYQESIAALNSRGIGEVSPKIRFYNGEKPIENPLVWEHMDELMFFVEAGNSQQVKDWTAKLFEFFHSIPNVTLSEVKSTCRILIEDVKGLMRHYYELTGGSSTSSSFNAILDASYDINSFQDYMLLVLPNIADMLNDKSVYASDSLAENIKTYIQKNYHRSLTLNKISSLFFINPSYCSYLFKEKTGVNFIDYVNLIRIDQAKILLVTSDEKVYKIAKSLGFDNSKYFFRVFKKLTGYTPEAYRENFAQQ